MPTLLTIIIIWAVLAGIIYAFLRYLMKYTREGKYMEDFKKKKRGVGNGKG